MIIQGTLKQSRMLSLLTDHVQKIINGVGIAVTTLLAYVVAGEVLGVNGIIAAVSGFICAIIGTTVTAIIALRKQRITEFTLIEKRSDAVHEREIRFFTNQIKYLQACERVSRQRAHLVGNELQRAILHIRTCEDLHAGLPEFVVRSIDEITAGHPLPEPPQVTQD